MKNLIQVGKTYKIILLLVIVVLQLNISAVAQDDIKPALKPNPSILEAINKLGDNESLLLEPTTIDGDLNEVAKKFQLHKTGPRTRDYCVKWVWMPDRKRAIFVGANHGVPHRLNDVWEYDLPSNTWYCLYGPDKSKPANDKKSEFSGWEDTLIKNEVLQTQRGGPAILGHTWGQLTYDPEMKAMLWLNSWSMVPKDIVQHTKYPPFRAAPLWAYYPESGKWEFLQSKTISGMRYGNSSTLDYISELNGDIWNVDGNMWLYTSKTNSWENIASKKASDNKNAWPAWMHVSLYIPEKKMIVAVSPIDGKKPERGGYTSVFSLKEKTWTRVTEGTDTPSSNNGFSTFVYDTVAKQCIFFDLRSGVLHSFDLEKKEWKKINPTGPAMVGKMGYYDEARNVFVLNQGSAVWLYRSKKE